jgi:hypothetical protein
MPNTRDENSDRQEHLSPKRTHPLQDRCVDDGVVERQRHLEDRQHHQQKEVLGTAVRIPDGKGGGGD